MKISEMSLRQLRETQDRMSAKQMRLDHAIEKKIKAVGRMLAKQEGEEYLGYGDHSGLDVVIFRMLVHEGARGARTRLRAFTFAEVEELSKKAVGA